MYISASQVLYRYKVIELVSKLIKVSLELQMAASVCDFNSWSITVMNASVL